MGSPISEFCRKYKEKVKNDEEINQDDLSALEDIRERINFGLQKYSTYPMQYRSADFYGSHLFMLDNEDLEYLYNKYSKQLQSEMEKEIANIKDKYKEIL